MTDDVMVSGMGGMACPGYDEADPTLTPCSSTADCGAGEECSLAPIFIDVGGGPPPYDPCAYQDALPCDATTWDGVCAMGQCGWEECAAACEDWCNLTTSECIDNACQPKRCDMEGALECGTDFRCAPDEDNADARGCARVKCDEANGPECSQGATCRPDDELANVVGCAPMVCDEPGAAQCPEFYACRPNDENASSGVGTRGCAPIPCDQPGGYECGENWSCLPDHPSATVVGCTVTPCDMGWQCDPWRQCNLEPASDGHGCADIPCTADADCPCGFCFDGRCAPEQPTCVVPEIIANPYGCVWPDDEFV